MSKKHYMLVAFGLTVLFSIIFFMTLPVEVAGHRPGNVPLLVANVVVVAVATALFITLTLIVLTKRAYVKNQLNTLKRFRHLLILMVKRDFVTRYRRSILGILWSVLNPLLTMLVLTMVFSFIFNAEIPNFPVYVLSGQIIYNFFSESTTRAMGSVLGNAGIIKKVYVPKYIYPVTNIISSTVNLGFAFIAFLLVYIIMGEPFRWTLLLIPIPILYTFVFSLGVGMLLSSMNVFFRDLSYLYGIGTTLLFFMTPIMYSPEILPERVYYLIHLNPLFHYVDYFRQLALNGTVPGLWTNIICAGFALAAFCGGAYVMMAQQDKYILYL